MDDVTRASEGQNQSTEERVSAREALEYVQRKLATKSLSPWEKFSEMCRWRERKEVRDLEDSRAASARGLLAFVKLIHGMRSELVEGYALPTSGLERPLLAMWSEINKRVLDMLLARRPADENAAYMRRAVAAFLKDAMWKATHLRSCLVRRRLRDSGLDFYIAVAPPGQFFLTSSFALRKRGFLYFGEDWLNNEETRRTIAELYFREIQRLRCMGANITHVCLSHKGMGFGKGTSLLWDPIIHLLKEREEDMAICRFFENSRSLQLGPRARSFSGGEIFFLYHRGETETAARGMIARANMEKAQAWVRFAEDARPDTMRMCVGENRIAPVPELSGIRDLIEEATTERKRGSFKIHADKNPYVKNKNPYVKNELMEKEDIPAFLESRDYSPKAIAYCVRQDPYVTLDEVYKADKEVHLNTGDNGDRERWRVLLKGLSRVGSKELMEGEKRFYDVSVTKEEALHDRDVGGSLGLAAACLTLMNANVADRVSQWYERRVYRTVARSKLGSY